jgi:hypothetical protein
MSRDATCEERIEEHLASRLEDMRDIMQRMDHEDEDIREDAYNAQNELPLSIDVKRTVIVQLSTGGPGDQFEIDVDDEGNVVRIRYRFIDWFDGAERTLSGDEAEDAEAFLDTFVEYAVRMEQ